MDFAPSLYPHFLRWLKPHPPAPRITWRPSSSKRFSLSSLLSSTMVKVPFILSGFPSPSSDSASAKTAQQCSTIDYCVRTTNRDISMCRNLGIPLSRLPAYPHDMRPRRQLSVICFPIAPVKSFAIYRTSIAAHLGPRSSDFPSVPASRLASASRAPPRTTISMSSRSSPSPPSDPSRCCTLVARRETRGSGRVVAKSDKQEGHHQFLTC